MADSTHSEQLEKRAADVPEPDPIADRSMSVSILVWSLVLVATLLWSLYDEVFGQRPWKDYQNQFVEGYSAVLETRLSRARRSEREIRESPEYRELETRYEQISAERKPKVDDINAQLAVVDRQLTDITETFQNERAWIAAQTYKLEVTESEGDKNSIRKSIEEKKNEKVEVSIHNNRGEVEEQELTVKQLEEKYNELRTKKAALAAQLVEITKPVNDSRKERDTYLQDQLTGLNETQLRGLLEKMNNFRFDIKQINVANGAVVDRCESCHLGVREPIPLSKKLMTDATDSDDGVAFVSHPNQELLRIHDPERFGCSTCHGGNGRGTTSVEKAHGRYKHWLWPLYYKENTQAGCNQCHNRDRVIQNADVLNRGKQLFQNRGCVGCHRYEAFDREADQLAASAQTVKQLEMEKKEYELARNDMLDNDADRKKRGEDRARRLVPNSRDLTLEQVQNYVNQTISNYDTRIAESDQLTKRLLQDQKKVGPNLKEIKAKINPNWLPVWLANPQAFRPGTKMPTFRLNDEEVQAMSAFLWQSAIDYVKPETQAPGDAVRGQELFKSLGCMACHSISGEAIGFSRGKIGGDFAADLSRIGEKANYDYIVRWVHNPRQRLAPYSPSLGRDLTPADYAGKQLPFTFDDQNSSSPVDGRELQVQNMTVMPNFRLSVQDARDIASFLIQQRKPGFMPAYADASSYLNNPSLIEQGKELVRRYGCAGCHEIKGMESEQRIGTELTVEGTKPIERLDFALLQEDAKYGLNPYTGEDLERGSWYNHKGFFEHKLRNPAIFDRGKEKAPQDRLRMPYIYLSEDDITALTTFLLGSVETVMPESIRYNATGHRKAVQDGWWVVQKYNCMGCHNMMVGQNTVLAALPQYQGGGTTEATTAPTGPELLPPRLTTEGARVQPQWLLKFLQDPSLHMDNRRDRAAPAAPPPADQNQVAGAQQPAASQSGQPPTVLPPGASASQTGEGTPQSPYISRLAAETGDNKNGVRAYLPVRMPTFNFSPNEVQALVNYFMGASVQPQPYVEEPLEPLKPEEMQPARELFTAGNACLNCHMTGDPVGDLKKKAPNFLIARERLKPSWTRRWIFDPKTIAPDTTMPSGLFKWDATRDRNNQRLVANAESLPPSLTNYTKDHLDLTVRYMFQITPEEQSRLSAARPSPPAAAPAASTTAATPPAKKSARVEKRNRGTTRSSAPGRAP